MESRNITQGTAPPDMSTPTCSRRSSVHISRKTSWGTPIPPPSSQKGSTAEFKGDVFDTVDLEANCNSSAASMYGTAWNTLENITTLGLSFNIGGSESGSMPGRERFSLEDLESTSNRPLPHKEYERPFNKWLKSLQRRATQRRKTVSCDLDGPGRERKLFGSLARERRSRHKKSTSGSSSAFVTAMKSASISIASFSIAPRSRKLGTSHHHQTDRSSKASNVGRFSEDSSYIDRGIIIDQAVTNRLLQRRRVLEEIITTEESYVADVKFLMNVRPPFVHLI
jgi:hypothetical protein